MAASGWICKIHYAYIHTYKDLIDTKTVRPRRPFAVCQQNKEVAWLDCQSAGQASLHERATPHTAELYTAKDSHQSNSKNVQTQVRMLQKLK